QALVRRLSGVDGATNGVARLDGTVRLRRMHQLAFLIDFVRPKNSRPFQWLPVIASATAVSEANCRRSYSKPFSSTVTAMVRPRYGRVSTVPGAGSRWSRGRGIGDEAAWPWKARLPRGK